MLILNGVKLAKNDSEMVSTLFQKDGTAKGFYKRLKHSIIIMDLQKKVIAHLTRNAHGDFFGLCRTEGKGYWYMPAANRREMCIFNIPAGYRDAREAISRMADDAGLPDIRRFKSVGID